MLRSIRSTFIMIGECFRMSLANILGNRARSFLTVLGILIGVAAVIALITTVNGFSGSLSSSFSSMGAGTLTVTVSGSDLKSGLTTDDLTELTTLEAVAGVTPNVSLSARVSRGGSYETRISVSGKNSHYFRQNADLVTRGRTLNVTDEDNTTFTCLISSDMVETFFYGVDPIGEKLYIDGIPFLVVGLMSGSGDSSISGVMNGSPDILIPYTTAMKMNNSSVVTSFTTYRRHEGLTALRCGGADAARRGHDGAHTGRHIPRHRAGRRQWELHRRDRRRPTDAHRRRRRDLVVQRAGAQDTVRQRHRDARAEKPRRRARHCHRAAAGGRRVCPAVRGGRRVVGLRLSRHRRGNARHGGRAGVSRGRFGRDDPDGG